MRKIKDIEKQEKILKEIISLNGWLHKLRDPYNADIDQYYFIISEIANRWHILKENIVEKRWSEN